MSFFSSSTGSMSGLSPTEFSPSRASQQAVVDNARIFDKSWETIQKKTFTNWINNQLKQKEIPPIGTIDTDLSSGEKLIQLLEIIGDESLGRYNKNPKLRIQKVENMNKALEFIRRRGVNLTNIGAEDIVDSNVKLNLGLIWMIILRFTIAEISEEGLSAKEGLLLWCQRRTAPYSADFHIKDFTFSWQDGLALCALIHRHRPDLLDYHSLDKSKKHENTQLAFDVAESQLGIAKLFGVEDIIDVAKPDERSVMTYVAQYFHAFSAQDKLGVAGRRVGRLGQQLQQAWEMQNDYEQRVHALMEGMRSIQDTWSRSSFAGYGDARKQLQDFEQYKNTSKRGWVTERRELDSLLGNIQTKLKTYNLRPYHPPQGLTLQDLASAWEALVAVEGQRKISISHYIRDMKESLKKKFADAANDFQRKLNDISSALADLEGDLQNQLDIVQDLVLRLEPLNGDLQNIAKLNNDCLEANIEDNEYTIYSVDDLSFDFGLLTQTVVKKSSFIENQMVARTHTNITAEQLDEFTESFRLCDKDGSNSLNREEFKSALHAEGTDFDDASLERLYTNALKGAEEVSFDGFIEFMKGQREDRVTPEQLKISFQTLAGDKSYVTETDLFRGGLAPALVEHLKQVMPVKEDGYDFTSFINGAFV
ncbi:calponin domain-containing protein [Fimicolochytrium jonesii]|uniref:calponin domain-containing protein n=1 Tax=Fimicolochytrium jonesii TaxID=1396493 RepID=UPI0022FEE47E|nr:calponin domain-containing protein [Fimicolochytrium jonesii]KAI8819850.1 calponin homology domain-containing protein [Fimicolochytrium jonesii]